MRDQTLSGNTHHNLRSLINFFLCTILSLIVSIITPFFVYEYAEIKVEFNQGAFSGLIKDSMIWVANVLETGYFLTKSYWDLILFVLIFIFGFIIGNQLSKKNTVVQLTFASLFTIGLVLIIPYGWFSPNYEFQITYLDWFWVFVSLGTYAMGMYFVRVSNNWNLLNLLKEKKLKTN